MNHLTTHKNRVSSIRHWPSCGENIVIYVPKGASTIVENPLQIGLIMQNKAKVKIGKMNISIALIKDYENKHCWTLGENKPKTKPNKANLTPAGQNRFENLAGRCRLSDWNERRFSLICRKDYGRIKKGRLSEAIDRK